MVAWKGCERIEFVLRARMIDEIVTLTLLLNMLAVVATGCASSLTLPAFRGSLWPDALPSLVDGTQSRRALLRASLGCVSFAELDQFITTCVWAAILLLHAF